MVAQPVGLRTAHRSPLEPISALHMNTSVHRLFHQFHGIFQRNFITPGTFLPYAPFVQARA
jgi:hypothetical protein